MRPGSVIGPQQQYLVDMERRGWRGNAPLPSKEAPAASALAASSARALAAQVTAGMCALGFAKAAASIPTVVAAVSKGG